MPTDKECAAELDERQALVHTKFPQNHLLHSKDNMRRFMLWTTFFRRNLHRYAMDYYKIKLYPYQALSLYELGVNNLTAIIASRSAAKSFVIALYACCVCSLYPHSKIVIASGTKGQSKLIVSEKIKTELMPRSAMLRREIRAIKDNQNDVVVYWKNGSTIRVVPASETARGNRSTVVARDEFRQIDKYIEDSVLAPLQMLRLPDYRLDPYYADVEELKEESVDIYLSSSWLDNGHWMWRIVDQAYKDMLDGKPACLLAFDECVTLMHGIKSMTWMKNQKKKQDPLTWRIEFLNERVKENEAAFFSYSLLQKNQVCKQPFYPRTTVDFRLGKKNPYDIPRQRGEIRVVACDMAFVEDKKNDNSVFSCIRLLPEHKTYSREDSDDLTVDNGYRRVISYLEPIQGGDTVRQAVRIRQLFADFSGDYIVLDKRNAGISVYDILARVMYDEERGVEYSPLSCMNKESVAGRVESEGAVPCIFVIDATQKLNSDIAMDFRRVLDSNMVDLLVPFGTAIEEILPNIKEYNSAPDAMTQIFYESPFLETQEFISETTDLVYEKKEQTGAIVIHEQGNRRKDRYTSVSYGSYFATLLEKDLGTRNEEYEFQVLIN